MRGLPAIFDAILVQLWWPSTIPYYLIGTTIGGQAGFSLPLLTSPFSAEIALMHRQWKLGRTEVRCKM